MEIKHALSEGLCRSLILSMTNFTHSLFLISNALGLEDSLYCKQPKKHIKEQFLNLIGQNYISSNHYHSAKASKSYHTIVFISGEARKIVSILSLCNTVMRRNGSRLNGF